MRAPGPGAHRRPPRGAALLQDLVELAVLLEEHPEIAEAIEKAIQRNARSKRLRGGSTISQQTAKNVFLWQGGGYFRKGLEAWYTVLIEALWPKRRILEVYANIAEFGDGIYGAEAAAQRFFGKPAARLTVAESAARPGRSRRAMTARRQPARTSSRRSRTGPGSTSPSSACGTARPARRKSTRDSVMPMIWRR